MRSTIVDGVLTSLKYPNGPYYPNVGKAWETNPDTLETNIGEIYLPLIPAETLKPTSSTEETVLKFPSDFISENPQFQGVEVRVPPNSLYSDDGTRGGMVGIAAVPPDRLPGTLPPNLQLQDVITVQTDGATNFDIPVPVCLPNLPDPITGKPLDSNVKTSLWSFNHDTGQFEVVGGMTVSEDGNIICSDPGVGILAPGWHGQAEEPERSPPCRIPRCCSICCEPPLIYNPDFGKCFKRCEEDGLVEVAACALGLALGNFPAYVVCLGVVATKNLICQNRCVEDHPRCLDSSNESRSVSKGINKRGVEIPTNPIADQIIQLFQERASLVYPFFIAGEQVPKNVQDQVDSIMEQADNLAGGDAIAFLRDYALELEFAATDFKEPFSNAPPYPIKYWAQIQRPTGVFDIRGETEAFGQYSIFTPRDGELIQITFYDPRSNSIAFVTPRLNPNARFRLPPLYLIPIDDSFPDTDDDGLVDIAEFVVGTEPNNKDTDADGVLDGTEIGQGLDPLDSLAVRTGIIGAADTSGTAVDVCATNDIVVVADSEAGVSVFNVFNGMNPIIIAQVDTPGTALAVSATGNLIGVADGEAGLAIIDISDPPNSEIITQVGVFPLGSGSAEAIVSAGDLAFVGTTTGFVSMVELSTGLVLQKLDLGGTVQDLAVEGTILYAYTNEKLFILPFDSGVLKLTGSVDVAGTISSGIRGRLFVGGKIAYPVNIVGYNTVDVSDTESPSLIAPAATSQRGWQQIVFNGSGLGVAAVGVNPTFNASDNNISLYDVSDPTITNNFITQFTTPGVARAVAIYNGIAYVADHNNGLQVINYLAYDSQGNPPSITLSISPDTNDVSEGELVILSATVNDDVQVRNVEFFVDGQRIVSDGNYPFEIAYRVPSAATASQLTLTAFASDTGGNRSDSTEPIVLNIIPDNEPPTVIIESPLNNQSFSSLDDIIVNVSAVDNVGIDSLAFLVDDIPVSAQRASFVEWVINIPTMPGIYSLTVVATDNNGFTQTSEPVPFVVEEEAVSREVSVISYAPTVFDKAVSRETSIFSFEGVKRNDTISREISIESKIE